MTGKRKIFPGRLGFLFGTPQVPGEALGTPNPPVKARQPPRPHLPNLQGLHCTLPDFLQSPELVTPKNYSEIFYGDPPTPNFGTARKLFCL